MTIALLLVVLVNWRLSRWVAGGVVILASTDLVVRLSYRTLRQTVGTLHNYKNKHLRELLTTHRIYISQWMDGWLAGWLVGYD